MIYANINEALHAAENAGAEVKVEKHHDVDGRPYVRATAIDGHGIWWLSFHEINGASICTWRLVKVAEGRRVIFAKF